MKYLTILFILASCGKAPGVCFISAASDTIYKVINCNTNYCLVQEIAAEYKTVISEDYVSRSLEVPCNYKLRE